MDETVTIVEGEQDKPARKTHRSGPSYRAVGNTGLGAGQMPDYGHPALLFNSREIPKERTKGVPYRSSILQLVAGAHIGYLHATKGWKKRRISV